MMVYQEDERSQRGDRWRDDPGKLTVGLEPTQAVVATLSNTNQYPVT